MNETVDVDGDLRKVVLPFIKEAWEDPNPDGHKKGRFVGSATVDLSHEKRGGMSVEGSYEINDRGYTVVLTKPFEDRFQVFMPEMTLSRG